MRSVEGDIAEEGIVLVVLDKLHRVIRKIVDDVACPLNKFAIVIQRRAEVAAPVAGGEAVVFIKAARPWMIRILRAVVPFAKGARGIACSLEDIGDGLLVRIQALAAIGHVPNAAARMITPGEKFSTRR